MEQPTVEQWNPTPDTQAKIKRSTTNLVNRFSKFIQKFDHACEKGDRAFGGPSLFFHYQCIKKFTSVPIESKLADNKFYELLYAVLASWGLHRMGKSKTKLFDYEHFKKQVMEQQDYLKSLEKYQIWSLSQGDLVTVQDRVGRILDAMKISKSRADLVANTKVLHHVLPDLVLPIDRNYTLRYFGINTLLPSQKPASLIFRKLFPCFVKVAGELKEDIREKIDLDQENWHTSFTKVLDNAVIGAAL